MQPPNQADPPEASATKPIVLLVRLDGHRYALPLDTVQRVLRAAAVTPLPEMAPCVLGLINLSGQLVPVFSLRRCLGLPGQPVHPDNQFVIVRTPRLTLAVVVDEVQELATLDDSQALELEASLRDGGCRAQGVLKLHGEIILIYDLDQLLSHAEQEHLAQLKGTVETRA